MSEQAQRLIYRLLEASCAPELTLQMSLARELFFAATGKVNDDDPSYNMRMGVFQEYFVFDYRLSEILPGSTVFELFLLRGQKDLPTAELHAFEQLRSMHASLFQVDAPVGLDEGMPVTCLLSGRALRVFPLPESGFSGFERNQVFEARLFAFQGVHYFTGNYVFHPTQVNVLIMKRIRHWIASHFQSDLPPPEANWREELKRRHLMLASVAAEKKQAFESERKRAIDMLNASKRLVSVSQVVSPLNVFHTIGSRDEVSPFVAEAALFDPTSFLQQLAGCELKCLRYRHIGAEKIYELAKAGPQAGGAGEREGHERIG